MVTTESVKYLGVKINANLTSQHHVNNLSIKLNKENVLLFKIRKCVSLKTIKLLFVTLTYLTVIFFFSNWDSLHARLNSHYKAWSYKKRRKKRLQDTENLFRKNLQLKDVC